jgi:hypothetical protein
MSEDVEEVNESPVYQEYNMVVENLIDQLNIEDENLINNFDCSLFY